MPVLGHAVSDPSLCHAFMYEFARQPDFWIEQKIVAIMEFFDRYDACMFVGLVGSACIDSIAMRLPVRWASCHAVFLQQSAIQIICGFLCILHRLGPNCAIVAPFATDSVGFAKNERSGCGKI